MRPALPDWNSSELAVFCEPWASDSGGRKVDSNHLPHPATYGPAAGTRTVSQRPERYLSCSCPLEPSHTEKQIAHRLEDPSDRRENTCRLNYTNGKLFCMKANLPEQPPFTEENTKTVSRLHKTYFFPVCRSNLVRSIEQNAQLPKFHSFNLCLSLFLVFSSLSLSFSLSRSRSFALSPLLSLVYMSAFLDLGLWRGGAGNSKRKPYIQANAHCETYTERDTEFT